jgi:hypothetical protein
MATPREPSTDWSETITAEEHERQVAFSDSLVEIQSRINAKHGPGRTFHRKPVAHLVGRLAVPGDLPPYAKQGLFLLPGEHDVVIRLSNGAMVAGPDFTPDVRGFAFSVRNLDGPSALGGHADRQDFLLINITSFGFDDTSGFAQVVGSASRGQLSLAQDLLRGRGVVQGSKDLARLALRVARPFTGFGTSDFHSCAAVAWGPYAAHVHLAPVGGGRPSLFAAKDWGADVRDRLAKGPLTYDMQAQFYTDDEHTPIETAARAWDAPKVTVARLTVTGLADEDAVEADRFDPWNSLIDHRPLGEIMRARKVAYYRSFENRR